ncbi:MAG TPA: SpoIID/LytB domain-containing protein [Paludibacteraceae bacterium]|nr:SpoIID/LytB domain-containing protein [Paludibacteraceae bacterium]HQB69342.1 SpoIID/LytB domain-containing protein [Paludibacteraceae bacterium]HRS67582.1 SpoIID/LytB domain-containing protein [Paludibacteraceae bacterium]
MIAVGIKSQSKLYFELHGDFRCVQTQASCQGSFQVELVADKIRFENQFFDELVFLPQQKDAVFELKDVTIGIDFHWERCEHQQFQGSLRVIIDHDTLWAVNDIVVEDYLYSVIASEMSATASLEFLKAHAVISRSWLLAPMWNKVKQQTTAVKQTSSNDTLIKWYERDAHQLFNVCADDHCQRYQGVARARTLLVHQAIEETRGEVLFYKGEICDARFSKSCGGVSERFESCWVDEHYDYLTSVRDDISHDDFPDLSVEANAEHWIRTSPKAFCNTSDQQILTQVLNQYDQETHDFYRWTVQYSTRQLSELIKKRSGIDFGTVLDLIPVERGTSGRLTKLKIIGTKRTLIVGKELEIRKWLSESHLRSSAFVVDKTSDGFLITGAGWGHGVGLCQIGAAVMGAQGYTYDKILKHYFRGAELKIVY